MSGSTEKRPNRVYVFADQLRYQSCGYAGDPRARIPHIDRLAGEMFGAQGRRAKNIFYEEAVRVPFLVHWQGHLPAAHLSKTCLNTPDIMPTLLAMMELPIPTEVVGLRTGSSSGLQCYRRIIGSSG